MKIKIERVMIHQFRGGLLGRCALANAGFDEAFYAYDTDTDPDGSNADTVLVRKDYLSIRTENKSAEYINAIAKRILGKPYNFKITFEDGIAKVERAKNV